MAKEKKTIQVQVIKDYANFQLANPNKTLGEKLGVIAMIEKVLQESNAYKGYMYLKLEFQVCSFIYTHRVCFHVYI